MASPLLTGPDSSTSLPSSIDGSLAVEAFTSQRGLMLKLIRHSLPSLANSLHAKGIISQDTLEFACNEIRGRSERGVALLDCVAARVAVIPSDFKTFVAILEEEPFLKSVGEGLIHSYCDMCTKPKSGTTFSPAIIKYRKYLKTVYANSPISPESKWPPTPSKKYINLAVVFGGTCRDDYIGHTLQGNIKDALCHRKEISIEQILEPRKGQNDRLQLVFVEGAPGIGKSTLAWELCRKWEEFACMKQYKLVILLRLREKEVQSITKVSGLFSYCAKNQGMSLADEVLDSLGNGTLFILDGFDELPKELQSQGFLVNLILGRVLPASTILVTSRPSATAELLVICRPRIQKRIEILGFTQESVEDYAASVLPDPETLEKFKDFISASSNPAINGLMYIPLNAAIILEIYQNCKSDSLLPHTLTELYTQLCLTYINRYLTNNSKTKVTHFHKLPGGLHDHFLELSKNAFEGVKNHQVTFHTMDPSLVHFGFLDAEPALYGGGQVSYNFLHLTLQEFLAAYHISHLREDGVKFLEQYGQDKQWRVVWRFVAGMTKFQYYQELRSQIFTYQNSGNDSTDVNIFFLQCLYEAQSVKYFPISDLSPNVSISIGPSTMPIPLDFYILGYCISALHTGLNWIVSIDPFGEYGTYAASKFICGLQANKFCASILKELRLFAIRHADVFLLKMKQCSLVTLTHLTMQHCLHANSAMIMLSEIIPLMPNLEELNIANNDFVEGHRDGLLKVLQELSQSNVKALNLCKTGFCKHLHSPSSDFYFAFKVCSTSGKLEKLTIDNCKHDPGCIPSSGNQKILLKILSASLLKQITLKCWDSSLSGLENSKNLVTLGVQLLTTDSVDSLIKIVNEHTVLQHLTIELFTYDDPLLFVKVLVDAICSNSTLKTVKINIKYWKENYKIDIRDSRITFSTSSFSIIE